MKDFMCESAEFNGPKCKVQCTSCRPSEATPSTAGSVREALEKAHGQFCLIAATNCWTHNNLQGWQESPGALREFAEEAAKEIDAALRAHGGGNE